MFFKLSNKSSEEPDARLIALFKESGDLKYLGELYSKYMHLVFGVCLKYLKEREAGRDAVMQIFEKLIVEIPKREIENFKPWLHVITKNHCLMQLRSEKSQSNRREKMFLDQEIFMENNPDVHHNDDQVLDRDLTLLKNCIEQLKNEQKECVKLFYLEEKCYREISEKLETDIKKVKSYIQNGKRNLKICMEQNGR